MDMRSEIKKLARMEEGPYPFLSLYLNTKWNDEQQRERIRLFTKNQLKKGYDQLKGTRRMAEGLYRRPKINRKVCGGVGSPVL